MMKISEDLKKQALEAAEQLKEYGEKLELETNSLFFVVKMKKPNKTLLEVFSMGNDIYLVQKKFFNTSQ